MPQTDFLFRLQPLGECAQRAKLSPPAGSLSEFAEHLLAVDQFDPTRSYIVNASLDLFGPGLRDSFSPVLTLSRLSIK
jgi:hypothetical protein